MDSIVEDQEDMPAIKTYPYGHDFGNSVTGGVLLIPQKGKEPPQVLKQSIPTAFKRIDISAMKNLGVDTDTPNMHQIRMQAESTSYAFGDLALLQGTEVWSGRDDHLRYASHYSVKALLVNSATLIPDKEYNLHVVTGLPADLYIKYPDLRKQIKAAIDGSYEFTLDNGLTYRKANVTVVTVVMEGAGALIASGAITDKNAESAVIDIGGGTTDLYVQRGSVPLPEFCKGKRIAVEAAQALLMESFEEKYGRALTVLEARSILYAHASGKAVNFPTLTVYSKKIELSELQDLAEEAVEAIGSDIASFVASAWRAAGGAARFSPVLLIGGGFYYFHHVLKERIPHLTSPEDPTHANALGYSQLAFHLLQKRLQDERAKALAERKEAAAKAAAEQKVESEAEAAQVGVSHAAES